MKKFIIIITFFIQLLAGYTIVSAQIQTVTPQTPQPSSTVNCPDGQYCLLEPLPNPNGGSDITQIDLNDLPGYIKTIFKIIMGIIGILAVIMIILGGVQYMSTDAVSGKEGGKETVTRAVGGLILALGAYLILNTINPHLLDINFSSVVPQNIVVNLDETNYKFTEQMAQNPPVNGTLPSSTGNSGNPFAMKGSFTSPQASTGVSDFSDFLKSGGKIDTITITAVAPNSASNKALFHAIKGTEVKTVTVPINIGYKGVSDPNGSPKPSLGDSRTPKGTSYISSDRRIAKDQNSGVLAYSDSYYNFGAAFINTGITLGGVNRSIGFHSNQNNTLGTTNGCIRMFNDDLVLLAPYMFSGIKVIIQ